MTHGWKNYKILIMNLFILIVFGFIQSLLEPLLWGIASYAFFILLVKDDRRWQIGAWITACLYFLWSEVISGLIIKAMGIGFSGQNISEFMADENWNIDLFDVFFSIGLAYGGFVLGRVILKKVARQLIVKEIDRQ